MSSSLVTNKMRVTNAWSFLNNIGDSVGQNTLYVGIGKTTPWNQFEGDSDFEVPQPTEDPNNLATIWQDLIGVQKIEKFDVRPVVPRKDWGDPSKSDSLIFYVGDVVAVNTIESVNVHPQHPAGIQVYQCVGIPDTGECSIDPQTINTRQDCIDIGGNWTPTESPGGIDNIPRTNETGFESGDGYVWDFLYSIPQDLNTSFVSADWLVVPTQNEITDERERWNLTDEVNLGDNRLMSRTNAYYLQITARVTASAFGEFGFIGEKFRQVALINNPLLPTNSTSDPIEKATADVYGRTDMLPDSGDIIFIENRLPVTRDIDQLEELRIIIEF